MVRDALAPWADPPLRPRAPRNAGGAGRRTSLGPYAFSYETSDVSDTLHYAAPPISSKLPLLALGVDGRTAPHRGSKGTVKVRPPRGGAAVEKHVNRG